MARSLLLAVLFCTQRLFIPHIWGSQTSSVRWARACHRVTAPSGWCRLRRPGTPAWTARGTGGPAPWQWTSSPQWPGKKTSSSTTYSACKVSSSPPHPPHISLHASCKGYYIVSLLVIVGDIIAIRHSLAVCYSHGRLRHTWMRCV